MEAVERQWDRSSVLDKLRGENEVRRRAWPRFLICMGALIAFTIVNQFISFGTSVAVGVGIVLNAAVIIFTIMCLTVTERHKAAALEAAEIKDKRALGYLIEVLDCDDKELVALARSTALELLADVREEDSDLFDLGHRDSMNWAVNFSKDLEIVIAILNVLRLVGGPESLAPLEVVANEGPSAGDKEHKRKVQDLARIVLADIRMRLARGVIDGETGRIEERRVAAMELVEDSHVDQR